MADYIISSAKGSFESVGPLVCLEERQFQIDLIPITFVGEAGMHITCRIVIDAVHTWRVHRTVCLFSFCLPEFGKSSWVSRIVMPGPFHPLQMCEHLQPGGHNAGGRTNNGRLVLSTSPASHLSALVAMHFNSTQKTLICHHSLRVFVKNCKISRLMLWGSRIPINIDIPDCACIQWTVILLALLLSSSLLCCSSALPWSTFWKILGSYWSHNKRQQEIKHGLWGAGIHLGLGCRCCGGARFL